MQILRARAVLGLYYKTQHEAQASGPPSLHPITARADASARLASAMFTFCSLLSPTLALRGIDTGTIMAKAKSAFVCQSCGTAYVRWQGRCEGCGEWNSVVEELVESGVGSGPK